jgi:hypothetical protein
VQVFAGDRGALTSTLGWFSVQVRRRVLRDAAILLRIRLVEFSACAGALP